MLSNATFESIAISWRHITLSVLVLIVVLSESVPAQFLRDPQLFLHDRRILIGTDVRAIGMGSAHTAGPTGGGSELWNPALIGILDKTEFTLTSLPFTKESEDREGAVSLAMNLEQLQISSTDMGNISISSWVDGWGADDSKSRMMLIGYGLDLKNGFSTGMSIRHHRRSFENITKIGWGLDLGGAYTRKLPRLGDRVLFGLALSDIGSRFWQGGKLVRDEKMPLILRFGSTYYIDVNTPFSVDLAWHDDHAYERGDRLRFHLGVERSFFNNLLFRIGYSSLMNYSKFTEGTWTHGVGLRHGNTRIDYAYVNSEHSSGSHWLSVAVSWLTPSSLDKPASVPAIVMPDRLKSRLAVSDKAISPNGDGIKDQTQFNFIKRQELEWQLEIRNRQNKIVRQFSGKGTPTIPITWAGKNTSQNIVTDGKYNVLLLDINQDEKQQLSSQTQVIIDTKPISFEVTANPIILTDSGNKKNASTALVVQAAISEPTHVDHWVLQFFAGEDLADQVEGKGNPSFPIILDSQKQHAIDSDIEHSCVLTLCDLAGNCATQLVKIQLIDLREKVIHTRQEQRGLVLTLSEIIFDTDSARIKSEFHETLIQIADAILAYSTTHVIIEGHTDNVGDANYNLALSEKRANAVMNYLITNFAINQNRISAVGYGETRGITENDTPENRQKNRRVEIILAADRKQLNQAKDKPISSYTLLVSSFKDRKNAEALVDSLESLKLNQTIKIVQVEVNSQIWYRVTVGSFSQKTDADSLIQRIETLQKVKPIMIMVWN